MPQPFSSRQDIKRDPLQDWVKIALGWVVTHRQTFFSVVGTVVVALVVALFVMANFRSLKRQAWERYSAGQNWLNANNPDNAMNFFNEVINNYGRTPAATYSLLAKADMLYRQRKFGESIEVYRQCLAKDPPAIIFPFVLSGLAIAQEDNGDYTSAIETYRQFTLNNPDHLLAPKSYESLARVYELTRNVEAAKEIYEKIITMFPATFWAEKARQRYQILTPRPFQDSAGERP